MKIALINGSPKFKESASGWVLQYLKQHMDEEVCIYETQFRKAVMPTAEQLEELSSADAWVFAYPLYVDGIPGHLLHVLRELEKADLQNPRRIIYGFCNCGFYEGEQNGVALEILKNWAEKCGYIWGAGFGIGGGGATCSLAGMGKMGQILMGPWPKALQSAAYMIGAGKQWQDDFVFGSIGLPRAIYTLCAHDGWKKKIKAAGGKVEDLERRF